MSTVVNNENLRVQVHIKPKTDHLSHNKKFEKTNVSVQGCTGNVAAARGHPAAIRSAGVGMGSRKASAPGRLPVNMGTRPPLLSAQRFAFPE